MQIETAAADFTLNMTIKQLLRAIDEAVKKGDAETAKRLEGIINPAVTDDDLVIGFEGDLYETAEASANQ